MIHIVLLLLLLPSLASAGPAEDDYAARLVGSSVHVDFDTVGGPGSDIIISGPGQNVGYDGGGVNRASLDTTIKRSGIGSLKFDINAPPHAGAQIAGLWTGAFAKTYMPGDTFYVQYAVRWSPWMLTNSWNGNDSFKVGIICFNTCPCTQIGLVMINWFHHDLPAYYTNCGNRFLTMNPASPFNWTPNTGSTYLLNGHDFNCTFGNWNSTGTCATFEANVWHTYTYEITMGAWAQPASHVKIFVWSEKVPIQRKIVDIVDYTFECNNMPACASNNTEGHNRLELTGAYMTGLQPWEGQPFPATVHYDEMIVSESPIPAPAVPSADSTQYTVMAGGSFSGGGSRR